LGFKARNWLPPGFQTKFYQLGNFQGIKVGGLGKRVPNYFFWINPKIPGLPLIGRLKKDFTYFVGFERLLRFQFQTSFFLTFIKVLFPLFYSLRRTLIPLLLGLERRRGFPALQGKAF